MSMPEWKRDQACISIHQDGKSLIVPLSALNQAVSDGTIRYDPNGQRFVTTLKGYAWIFGLPYDEITTARSTQH